ncbi:MAG TPA: serine hydrolase [Haliscomenobacter sp.]|uniref:serine hydrolase domain-containing protein n=1 Tax=Haliscomenobacter sp. TaxID=2717303 RepID=UPI002C25DCA2|nr:serine hydrolase [Haliscomenobacter sp.]HOY20839.1 serine hydrolase [Haliscomenobacter sp.]
MSSTRRDFIGQVGLTSLYFGLGASFSKDFFLHSATALPRSTPAAQGVDASRILSFIHAIQQSKHEFHSFILLRHGQVVAEGWWAPYAPDLRHTLYSMSKSFASTAVGFAVMEGKLKVSDPVVKFFPADLPATISPELAKLTVKDLLTMSVGHELDTSQAMRTEENWVKAFLAFPFKHQPGTQFLYNSGATYMCSAIVQKVTGQKIVDYLKPRLFDPLQIEGMDWETCPKGINVGGWGLRVKTEDLAKFGQLFLQKGQWNGRQIVSREWVQEATSFKIQQPAPEKPSRPNAENDWLQGYGYQFWRCRNNAYRGDGAFGQYTIVMPEQDAVLAITSESPNMQGQLDLIWEHLLPAFAPASASISSVNQELQATISSLALPLEKSPGQSAWIKKISKRKFQLENNDLGLQSMRLSFSKGKCVVDLTGEKENYSIHCGLGSWKTGETTFPGNELVVKPASRASGIRLKKIAANGYWKDENTFEMTWRYIESAPNDLVTCHFSTEGIKVAFVNSRVKLNPNNKDLRPELKGTQILG